MLSRGRMLLAVTFLHATVAARINVLPNLSRSLDQQQHSQEQRQHLQTKHSQPLQHQRFHIVAALDGDATKVLSSLFGTCFPFDDAESVLHASLRTPSPTSPALLLLAPPGDVAPLSALALSDVWVAVLPEGADERVTDAMVERVLTALAQLPPSASGPRQLIVVSQQAAAAATGGMAPAEPASQSSEPPEQLQQRLWSRLQEKQALRCAAGGACPLVASLLRLHCASSAPASSRASLSRSAPAMFSRTPRAPQRLALGCRKLCFSSSWWRYSTAAAAAAPPPPAAVTSAARWSARQP